MKTTFYFNHDSDSKGGYTNESDGTIPNVSDGSADANSVKTKFPEDPSTNDEIRSGGGPADGFVDESGRVGNGFNGHVEVADGGGSHVGGGKAISEPSDQAIDEN